MFRRSKKEEAAPTPLTAFKQSVGSTTSPSSTPSTTSASPASSQKLSVVNVQTFFQQHPLTPPPLPPNLDHDFDLPPLTAKSSHTSRHASRRRMTEQAKGIVTERHSDECRRASDFRGPAPIIAGRSPRTDKEPLLTQSTSPVVKQLHPANESFVLATTRTGGTLRTSRTGHTSSTTSPTPRALVSKPHPDYLDRISRLKASPDKYRDDVIAELFSQVKRVPVGGLTTRRRSFEPNRDTAMTALTIAVLLDAASDELDRPLKDVSQALRDSDAALERSVDIARLATERQSDSAPQLIASVGKVSRKKFSHSSKGAQGRTEAATACVDTGVAELMALALSPRYVTMMPPDFLADGLAILNNGLACQESRAATRHNILEARVPATAEDIIKNPRAPPAAKEAAAEFGLHLAESPPDRDYLAKHHPALLEEEETVPLPMLMRVVRRKVGAGRAVDKTDEQLLPYLGHTKVVKAHKRERADVSDELEDIIARFENQQTLNDPEAAGAFAELVSTYAAKRRARKVVEAGGHELLLKLLKIHADDPIVVGPILDAFSCLCEDDTVMQFFTADNVPPVVKAHAISEDPDCVYKYVDLLEDLVIFGADEARGKIAKAKVLSDLDLLEEKADPEEVPLLISIGDIRKCLNPEENPLTLKEVYSILMSRQYNDESLNIVEERSVKRLFNFVRKKVREYGADGPITDGVFGFTASELMYGCMSFQLLAGVEDNHALFKQYDIPQLMLDVMRVQPDEQIAQHAVLTASEIAQHETLVGLFVDKTEKKQLIVQMLKRGRKAVENDVYNDVEDLIAPRVQLIERTAISREIYTGTEAVQQLIETWDDYEYYFFGNIRVRNRHDLNVIFKADRKDKRKAKMHKRLHRAHPSQPNLHQDASPNSTSDTVKKKSLVKRASQFIRRKESDEDRMTRGNVLSPLERRKSIVGGQQAPMSPSPLERRKSVVPGGRRQSLGGGLLPVNAESQAPAGLMRRASQLFSGGGKAEVQPPTGMMGAGGTIAQARAAASGHAPVQRRGSFFARAGPAPSPTVVPNSSPDKRRASLLQRRASMTSPVAEVSNRKAATRRGSNASSVNDAYTANGSFKSGRSFGSESRWSDFDFEGVDQADTFVPHMLEYVFKALRRTVWTPDIPYLRKQNVPMRLVGLIADHETPPAAFPDILYLIGMLAGTDKTLKEEFGELQAVEKACSLLKRAYRQQGAYVSEVVTNACLCLATLTVVHLPNTRRFEKKKGPQLTVDALRARGDYNDTQAVNAASALICNLCYKNEAMKTVLGEAGASEALVRAMAKYESTGSKLEGTRCISSLFKAIGNLSLNQENMEKLLASDVEIAYSSFLGQVDGELDDSTLEAALRTLSNLVIEKDNMERFAPVVVPFLSMLRRERTTSSDVHRWAFMTLAGLCRRPKNAQTFCENDGVRTIMKLVPYLEQTPGLRASIICLLGIQTTHPPNVKTLVEDGVFAVIAQTLREFLALLDKKPDATSSIASQQFSSASVSLDQEASEILAFSQLPISSLRCAHRCLTNKQAAQECIKEEVFDLTQQVLIRSAFQPMLTYETLRVIFGCMQLIDPQRFSKKADFDFLQTVILHHPEKGADKFKELVEQWGEKELELLLDGEDPRPEETPYVDPTEPQWLLTMGDHVRRPAGRRIWEELNMTPHMISICESVRQIASSEKAQRNVRLQRCALGALAWISCERVCAPSLFRRLHIPIDPDLHCPAEDMEEEEEVQATAPPPLQRRKSIWDALKRDKTQVHISLEDSSPLESSVSRGPAPAIQRRKSVWDAFKRDKHEKDQERKTGFGRERKHDETSVVDLIRRTLKNLWFDTDCVDLAMLLLNNCIWMCFGHQDLAPLLAEVDLYKELKSFVDRNAEKVKAYWLFTLRNYKRFMQTQGKFHPIDECSDFSDISHVSRSPGVGRDGTMKPSRTQFDIPGVSRRQYLTGDDLGLMHAVAFDSFPIDLTQWDIDPFPDGVQSLPAETRRKLRSGGKCEYIDVTGKRNYFYYKSSHDLVLFEWKMVPLDQKVKEVDPQYPHALAVSRFHAMSPGIDHVNFHRGMQFDRGITESKCCLLRGPAIHSMPEGVNLTLKFKDHHTRDHFITVMGHWREACAFGFI